MFGRVIVRETMNPTRVYLDTLTYKDDHSAARPNDSARSGPNNKFGHIE
jgi:hypothetical protein